MSTPTTLPAAMPIPASGQSPQMSISCSVVSRSQWRVHFG